MILSLKNVILASVMVITVSCGAKTNKSPVTLYGSALLEQQCADNNVPKEAVTFELNALYTEVQEKAPLSFFNLPEKNYDYKTPMVVNLADMQEQVRYIKNMLSDEEYREANYTSIAHLIYFEYQKALRYEGLKCSQEYLATKKANDITPYMNMKAFCLDKNEDELCTMETLLNLSVNEENMVIKNNLTMCSSLTNDPDSCQVNYSRESVGTTQSQFKKHFYDSLFKLRPSHLKFNCEKDEEITTMNIKVLSSGWEPGRLQSILDFISSNWSKQNFKLVLEITDTRTDVVIEIIPTNRSVSYVPDNNNRQIYINQALDSYAMKRVLVHEFGHVLGFPDCYTEFYDNEKKSLIYYEISKDNTNIMCSLKSGVSVPDDYTEQLAQNSCLFN